MTLLSAVIRRLGMVWSYRERADAGFEVEKARMAAEARFKSQSGEAGETRAPRVLLEGRELL